MLGGGKGCVVVQGRMKCDVRGWLGFSWLSGERKRSLNCVGLPMRKGVRIT